MIILLIFSFLGCKKFKEEEAVSAGDVKSKASTSSVTGNEFTIAIIPDTQFYIRNLDNTAPKHYLDFFTAQTQWIADNDTSENIVYAIHLGDVSEDGDYIAWNSNPWKRIDTAMKILDVANMPYGVAVGNHDQGNIALGTRGRSSATTVNFNTYFGKAKFADKSWYGGNYNGRFGDNNDSHYDLFSAGGIDFIVIYLEFDDTFLEDYTNQNTWAYNLLTTYSNRKGIIVTHYLANADTHATAPSAFSDQGQAIYNKIKSLPNVLMMLGGHVPGESYRQDTYNGKTVKSFISDYQANAEGGGGYMRIMKFSPDKDIISVKTYSPKKNIYYTDANSQFTVPLFKHESASRTYDFDQDGGSELAFFNAGTGATTGIWKISGMSNVNYGGLGDVTIPADFDGNGKTDIAIYKPSTREFHIIGKSPVSFGNTGDIPVPADYDADGKAEIALWRPSNGTWYVKDGSTTIYGQSGDIPIPADYDGNGFVQPAYYRPSNKTFNRLGYSSFSYGNSGDIPVVGDYNGDGKTEVAIYRPYKASNPTAPDAGHWYNYNNGTDIYWGGQAGDIPAPADYDGDGDTDIAYYRAGVLYVYGGTNITLGSGADEIVNLPYPVKKHFFP